MTKQEWLDKVKAELPNTVMPMWEKAADELEKRGVDFDAISDGGAISALETAFDYYAKADVDDADWGVDFITEYCDGFSGYQIKELAGYVESQMYEVQDEVEHPIFTDEIRDEVFVPEHTPKEMHNMVSSLVEGAYTPTLYTDRAATKEEAAELFTVLCERNGNEEGNLDGYEGVKERIAEIEGEGYAFEGAKVDRFMVHVGPNFEGNQLNIHVPQDHLVMTFRNADGQARYCIVNADGEVVKQPLSRLEYKYDMDHATVLTYYEGLITEVQERFEEAGIPVEKEMLYTLIPVGSDFDAEDVDGFVDSMREMIETLPLAEDDVPEDNWYGQNAVGSVPALTHELHMCGKDRTADALQVMLGKVEGSDKMLQFTHYSVDQGIVAGAWLSIGSHVLQEAILERGFRPTAEVVKLFSPIWCEHADVKGAMLEVFREDAKTMSREELCAELKDYLVDTSHSNKERYVHISTIEKLADAIIEGKEINPESLTYENLQGPANDLMRDIAKIGADKEEVLGAFSGYVDRIFTNPDSTRVPWRDIAKDENAPVDLRVIATHNCYYDGSNYRGIIKEILAEQSAPVEFFTAYMEHYGDSYDAYVLAKVENAPVELIRELVITYPEYVKDNPNVTTDVLVQFSKDEDPSVRAAAAGVENLPQDRLSDLAKDPDERVRLAVAGNPAADPDSLRGLSTDKSVEVQRAVSENRSTPPDALDKLSESEDKETRLNVAGNTSSDPDTLDRMVTPDENGEYDYNTIMAIASNTETSPDTLDRIGTSLLGTYGNWNASLQFIRGETFVTEQDNEIIGDRGEEVRDDIMQERRDRIAERVFSNPSTSAETFEKVNDTIMKTYLSMRIVRCIAGNPSAPPDVLSSIVTARGISGYGYMVDGKVMDVDLAKSLVSNPSIPSDSLEKIIRVTISDTVVKNTTYSRSFAVSKICEYGAMNPNATASVLDMMYEHGEKGAVCKRLGCDEETLDAMSGEERISYFEERLAAEKEDAVTNDGTENRVDGIESAEEDQMDTGVEASEQDFEDDDDSSGDWTD